ncbi:sigma-70 family RNA polymerase sigma factor [Lentzea sp. BCCO 10_0856]|uniref:Sigma-70 family RNA polymerase sigma factor n=1 Tax=Lentzea miocenica TaxID=3095431 RepID=A0ABU4SYL1_9PSEU|nr:sigma-70 family RNA polymerase sigma factor [Lentzea sp. BCCO 10_0856]MDX8031007.1 sigma-70 family RNA polymerase sigma factor [Lentzea sp. BCCO 10_0856]
MIIKGPDSSKDGNSEGDGMSIEAFLEVIHPRLRSSAGWMVNGDDHLAQDMVQETALKLWRRHQALREDGKELRLSTGLAFVTLRNTVNDHFRREAVRTRTKGQAEVVASNVTATDPATIVTEDDATRTFFESLGPEQQQIMLLHVGGYTLAEIGAELGLAKGTVSNYLTSIRKAFLRSFPDAMRRRFPDS